jgi:hypothetical protein
MRLNVTDGCSPDSEHPAPNAERPSENGERRSRLRRSRRRDAALAHAPLDDRSGAGSARGACQTFRDGCTDLPR